MFQAVGLFFKKHMTTVSANTFQDTSYTAAAEHMTAAALGKTYEHEFVRSENPDKSAFRTDDGALSSGEYLARTADAPDEGTRRELRLDYHHPLEDWLGRRPIRWLLRML